MPKLKPISPEAESILIQAKYWAGLLHAAVGSRKQLRGTVSTATLRRTRMAARALYQEVDKFLLELGFDPTAGHPDRSPAVLRSVQISAANILDLPERR